MVTEEQLIEVYESTVGPIPQDASAALKQKLASIVARPHSTRGGIPAYPTLFAKIASLIQGLVHEKPFPQANREVARVCVERILTGNGYQLTAEDDDIDRLMQGVELGITLPHRITLWLKKHTRRELRT